MGIVNVADNRTLYAMSFDDDVPDNYYESCQIQAKELGCTIDHEGQFFKGWVGLVADFDTADDHFHKPPHPKYGLVFEDRSASIFSRTAATS